MTAAVLDRPTTRRRPAAPRRSTPSLRLLDPQAERRRARRRSALVLLFFSVLVGFFCVAFVHAELVAGQYELDAVRTQISEADARRAELARAVEEASAPNEIVTRATALGMVPATEPVYLQAAAPLRSVEVAAPARSMAEVAAGADADLVAAAGGSPPGLDEPGVDSTPGPVSGALGSAGGISAAVHLIDTETPIPALAMDAEGSSTPIGVQASSAATSALPTAVAGATTVPAAPSDQPVSTLAGTRAVTGGSVGGASTDTGAG